MSNPSEPTIFGRGYPADEAWLARAIPEPALDPDLPIVDTHHHLWDRKLGRYFLPDFAADIVASGHNIEASIYIENHAMYRGDGPDHFKSVGETEFAVGMAAMAASGQYTSTRVAAGIVANIDLMLGERLEDVIEGHAEAANGRLRGVRQRAKWDADPDVKGAISADKPGLYLEPEFGNGLDVLTRYGLVFEASIYHPQISDVIALARAHPQANIVLIHSGSPVGHSSYRGRERENHQNWLADMTELAKCPNASVKLGGLLMSLANFDFNVEEKPPTSEELATLWGPYIEPCFELFGAERCMVGSNFPVEKAGFGYGTLWNMFKRLTQGCSAAERSLIFSGTAKRVYSIS